MNNPDRRKISRKWSDNLFVRYFALTIVISVVFAALTVLLNLPVESENIRTLLTTFALAEASILAIVFSVTVVALQLVVTRYSARLTSLFVKEPLFRITFGLFIGAIAFDLLAVYSLPIQSSHLSNAAVGIAFALGGVSTIALYQFIQVMIQRSSPDELIRVLIERELAPGEYLPKSVENFQEIEVHPLRPLYRTIARAIELGEYQTAEQGIDGLRTVLKRTFEYLESEYPDDGAAQYAPAVSKEPLTEYFPPILEQAYAHEQYDLASSAVDDVEALALDGLDRGFTDVTEDAADGLGDAFNETPLTLDGNRLRDPVSETLVELTTATATKADYSTFSSVFFNLDLQMTVLLRRRTDSNVTHRLVGDYYTRDSIDIFEALVDRYGPKVQDQEIVWISPTDGRISTLPDEAEPLRHFWRRYTKFTQAVLRYRLSEEEYPFVEGSIDDGWKGVSECAAEAGLNGLATLCIISTIQLAYNVDQLENGRVGIWLNNLGLLRRDYNPAIVDQAFALLKKGEQPKGANISTIHFDKMSNETEVGFIERMLDTEEGETSFEEWIVEFEKNVQERTEYLRDRK